MEIKVSLGRRMSPRKSSNARLQCQQRHLILLCPSHISLPSSVKKHSTSTITVGVATPLRCTSSTWASSCPKLSAWRKGSASLDPSKVNQMDHKLGLPVLCVPPSKSMYMSPRVALAFQKELASTQMTIRNFRGRRP